MQEKSDKAFDRSLREKFREFGEEPSAAVWEQIARGLDRPAKKRLPYAWLAAACVMMVASLLLWRKQEPEKMNLAKAPVANLPIAEDTLVSQENFNVQSIVQTNKKVAPTAVSYKGQLDVENELMVVVPSLKDEPAASTALQSQAAASAPVAAETVIASLMPDTEIAVNTSPELHDSEETAENLAPKQKKGLGKLVNFVLSQVDPREDKLIEVSEDAGEGIRVTGLNFGLVKMKNKSLNK